MSEKPKPDRDGFFDGIRPAVSDAPTPEVDAFDDKKLPPQRYRWREFARRLERERDEWKTKAILRGNAAIELEEDLKCVAKMRDSLRERVEELKEIGQGFERDSRKFFEQSCLNLKRAEKAEESVAELVREAKAYIDTMGDYTRTSESLRNVLAKHKEA